MAQEPSAKKQRTRPQYELLYHPGIPGRGEFARLMFEATGVPYSDLANESDEGTKTVYATCTGSSLESADDNPPVFAPPALRISGAGPHGKPLIISQTPNILSYLGDALNLVPDAPGAKYHVAQVALTALDLNNEVHDSHHPISVSQYYEDQRDAAKLRSADFRENRLPKFLSYFQRVLQANRERGGGEGKYLVGKALTYADTTVWQVLDGLYFAFPEEMKARKGEFSELLEGFYEGVKGEGRLKEYLGSERRLPYSMGVFRHYPELDRR